MRGNTNTISFLKAHSNKMALNYLLVSSYLRRVGKYKTDSMVLFCGHFVTFLFVFSHIIIFSIFLELCFCGYFVHFMVLPLYFFNWEWGNIILVLREYLGTDYLLSHGFYLPPIFYAWFLLRFSVCIPRFLLLKFSLFPDFSCIMAYLAIDHSVLYQASWKVRCQRHIFTV